MADIKTSTNPPKTKIFVGRLPENAQAPDLRRLFEQYGTVTECDILNRYGFVHMKTEEQATRAIENLHNCNFMGSLISVEASTGKRGGRDGPGGPGPRRGGFGGRGGRGGFGPMRGGMGYGMGRAGPYDRAGPYSRPDGYGRPDAYGRPEPYGRPDFDRRPVGPGPAGPGPVPAGPGPVPPAGAPMGAMRNGYYDDRRDAAYMDRSGADYMDRRDRGDAAYGMGMARMDNYDRGYGDYAARAVPLPNSDMYGAGAYREADRSAYADMRQPYERRDMVPREMPAARDAYDRTAMAAQNFDRRDYGAARMAGASDMFSRRTPPPQPAYSTGYPDMQPRRY
ncbi:RNA-binding protein 4.1-like isoform X2 [Thrips palmi]|uniref:RNA-binding protein 4.1-like isoform X2 n=1 Tax=Thrips palmi TaxID=161013 RepID=A0A6P9A1H3_THRPL|nr:RNA-binding protein 4.1-like isoform X2 [Thrips palmi]